MRPVCWTHDLSGDENDVKKLTDEQKPEGAELQETQRWVAEIKSVRSEHSQEYRQQ